MSEEREVINYKTVKVQGDKIIMSLTYNAMKAPFYSKSSKYQQDMLESRKVEEFP